MPAALPALPEHATRFLRGAGLVRWDAAELRTGRIGAGWCRMLHAVAQLEADTAITVEHAHTLGLDRHRDLAAFLPVWAAEEAEHARALRALLGRERYEVPPAPPAAIARTRHLTARIPRRPLGRWRPTGVVFGALGAAAEYVTVVVYQALAAQVGDPGVSSLLRDITRQERRHCAFFLAAARTRAPAMSRFEVRATRRVLTSMWAPPGVPSLGLPVWLDTFAPLLGDPALRARVRGMDRIVDSVPGLDGLHLMDGFLAQHLPPDG
jgi:hypothetical protein